MASSVLPILRRRLPFVLCLCTAAVLAFCFLRSHVAVPHGAPTPSDKDRGDAASKVDLSRPDAPFVSWPLARVCSEAQWTPGIVFLCDNNSGGIGNIRNAILTCLRYAIEAGATGLVLPAIRTRSEQDLNDLWREYKPFDYFFDETHFTKSLAEACPQISVYPGISEILGVHEPDKFEVIRPKDLGALQIGCDKGFPNMLAHSFGDRFRAWVAEREEQFRLPPLSLMDRRVFRLPWGQQFEWPVWSDGPEFVATFGGLLKFRRDILELGATLAGIMRSRAAKETRDGTGFVGMHLRTEHDALPAWPTFENQTTAYLQQARERGFRLGYLATGNQTQAEKFRAQALRDAGLHLVTKEDVLQGRRHEREQALFHSLTWDQRALVDFVVLAKSDFFLGMNPSTFSMNVALKRHLQVEGLATRPWKVGKGDARSWLVGNYRLYWDGWLWFYDTMWA